MLVVANQRSPQASLDCVAACVDYLEEAQSGVVLFDSNEEAFLEYRAKCSLAGQPGVGDAFLRWFHSARWNPQFGERIEVPPPASQHVPQSLAGFDRSDHKWVAIYLLGGGDEVVNAVDSDWSNHATEMQAEGINVRELC